MCVCVCYSSVFNFLSSIEFSMFERDKSIWMLRLIFFYYLLAYILMASRNLRLIWISFLICKKKDSASHFWPSHHSEEAHKVRDSWTECCFNIIKCKSSEVMKNKKKMRWKEKTILTPSTGERVMERIKRKKSKKTVWVHCHWQREQCGSLSICSMVLLSLVFTIPSHRNSFRWTIYTCLCIRLVLRMVFFFFTKVFIYNFFFLFVCNLFWQCVKPPVPCSFTSESFESSRISIMKETRTEKSANNANHIWI